MDYKRRGLAKQQGQVAVLVEIGPREPYKIIFRIMSAIAAYTYAYFKWKTNQKKKKNHSHHYYAGTRKDFGPYFYRTQERKKKNSVP